MTNPTGFRLPALCAAALLLAGTSLTPLVLRAEDKPVADPAPPAEFLAKLDPQMREVVQAMLEAKPKPFYQLEADAARRQPPPGVAAALVAKKHGKAALDEVGDRDKVSSDLPQKLGSQRELCSGKNFCQRSMAGWAPRLPVPRGQRGPGPAGISAPL